MAGYIRIRILPEQADEFVSLQKASAYVNRLKVEELTAASLKLYSDPTMWEMARSCAIVQASMMTCADWAILCVWVEIERWKC